MRINTDSKVNNDHNSSCEYWDEDVDINQIKENRKNYHKNRHNRYGINYEVETR